MTDFSPRRKKPREGFSRGCVRMFGRSMAAAAAMAAIAAAATGFEIAGFRNAAEFKTLADILHDGLLDTLHFLLGVEEAAGDFVLQKRFAELFKIVDLGFFQLHPGMALLLKKFALGDQRVVLAADGVGGEERFNLLAQALDFGLVQDSLAKFLRFLNDDRFFSLSLHKLLLPRADNPASVSQYNTGLWKMQGGKGGE
jgi:hypothetical protein